jgi:hypothetical protein
MGSKDEVTTTESDPWENMPDWQKEAYENDAARREELLDKADITAGELNDNVEQVSGISEGEKFGLGTTLEGGRQGNAMGEWAQEGLTGIDVDQMQEDNMSGYTDDVVDTTLAGMDRQNQRDQLGRDSRAASVGGTSNTRAAVGNAVANNLHGMNMGEMEAKLRDNAHQFGTQSGLEEAGFQQGRYTAGDQLGTNEMARYGMMGDAMTQFGEKERLLNDRRAASARTNKQQNQSWLADMQNGGGQNKGPVGSTDTSTKPGPSTFSQILGGASAIGGMAMMSDERVKENISDITPALDKLAGLNAREYNYKKGYGHTEERTTGLMAQDLERVGITGAVRTIDGIKHVDPYPVLATVVQAVAELDRKLS